MSRFYVQSENIKDDIITITGSEVRHIIKVLRHKTGDIINLIDGTGIEYSAKIKTHSKDKITAVIISKTKTDMENKVDLILYQGLIRSDKMDFIIQKAVELGVNKIVPIYAERSQYKPDDSKIKRWRKIAESASCQSGRTFIMEVTECRKPDEVLFDIKQNDLNLVFSLDEKTETISSVMKDKKLYKKIGVFIGPEGDFTAEETGKLRKSGAKLVSLGKRILRAETAVVVGVGLVLYLLGEF